MRAEEIDSAEPVEDRIGLDKAYAAKNNVYVEGDTLYISGTSSGRDVADDLYIPLGQTYRTKRWGEAHATLEKSPQIKRVVGHSLGGAVALTIAQQYGLESRTYGAPVMSFSKGERYRNYGDPVSGFDYGASSSISPELNPHSYQRLARKTYTPGAGVGKDSFNKNGVVNMFQ